MGIKELRNVFYTCTDIPTYNITFILGIAEKLHSKVAKLINEQRHLYFILQIDCL